MRYLGLVNVCILNEGWTWDDHLYCTRRRAKIALMIRPRIDYTSRLLLLEMGVFLRSILSHEHGLQPGQVPRLSSYPIRDQPAFSSFNTCDNPIFSAVRCCCFSQACTSAALLYSFYCSTYTPGDTLEHMPALIPARSRQALCLQGCSRDIPEPPVATSRIRPRAPLSARLRVLV